MRLQLLIATNDKDWAGHLSRVLSDKHAETFEVTVCSLAERLGNLLSTQSFDAALIEPALLPAADLSKIKLPLMLWDGVAGDETHGPERVRKYRRVSRIGSDILEEYSKIAAGVAGFGSHGAKVTAVWSPSGGSGKTTVAMAYAAGEAAGGGEITYLDLEFFSSTPVYFPESAKSISTSFSRLDGNAALLLKAIALRDSGSGITYFTRPDNYDDMNELTAQDVETLVSAVSEISGEVVVDLPSVCDERFRAIMERADAVFVVADGSKTAMTKLRQFTTQHNLFEKIRAKATLVANKNAKCGDVGFGRVINLPTVSSGDPVSVYKTLSGVSFE